jgi:hypothetical protein
LQLFNKVNKMIVLVTGGRKYNNIGAVFDAIVALQNEVEIDYIVHGGAEGADTLADDVAKALGINRITFPANWTKHGKAAGPIRNGAMIKMIPVDLVLAFPGNTGTKNMKEQATRNGIEVIESVNLIAA